ncbi:MAG: ribonuclease HI family protein [Chloroflexota bacterium]|nr:ribonuclease HI family protein [Chloroflexota bacterium]
MTDAPEHPIDTERMLRVDPAALDHDSLIRLARDLQRALGGGKPPTARAKPNATQASLVAQTGPGSYTLTFDGGSKGNPGLGYGSYEIEGPHGVEAANRMEFGHNMTNNQAEFLALISGLKRTLELTGGQASTSSLAIRGDSQLVIRGLKGEWKIKHPNVQPLYQEAGALLKQFGKVNLAWQPRRESVRTFGH